MKLTSPEDLKKIAKENVTSQLKAFENLLQDNPHKIFFDLTIYMETSAEDCKIIIDEYKDVGWYNVSCVCIQDNLVWKTILKMQTIFN